MRKLFVEWWLTRVVLVMALQPLLFLWAACTTTFSEFELVTV